jgi:enoyl-CoA hydratase/carnithine racemase
MNMPRVLVEFRDAIGIITLNHPEKHNAHSAALIDQRASDFASLMQQE